MVLSACSPYFQVLFTNTPDDKHPILILKDISLADMKSLLDFMYRGEVSVDQERLTAFLRVAESLRIKGLTEVNDDKPQSGNSSKSGGTGTGGNTGGGGSGGGGGGGGGGNGGSGGGGSGGGASNDLNNASQTPPPPQLHRIQPYLMQQQQQQRKVQQQQQQQSGAAAAAGGGGGGGGGASGTGMMQNNPLLGSALTQPKRKRGRPRKLSGSSNGTANDFDDYESRDNLVQVKYFNSKWSWLI